jgi:hypothetical protein
VRDQAVETGPKESKQARKLTIRQEQKELEEVGLYKEIEDDIRNIDHLGADNELSGHIYQTF